MFERCPSHVSPELVFMQGFVSGISGATNSGFWFGLRHISGGFALICSKVGPGDLPGTWQRFFFFLGVSPKLALALWAVGWLGRAAPRTGITSSLSSIGPHFHRASTTGCGGWAMAIESCPSTVAIICTLFLERAALILCYPLPYYRAVWTRKFKLKKRLSTGTRLYLNSIGLCC